MIITIAVVGEPQVTKMVVHPSETMREVVARFSPNLDARLVASTSVSRPTSPQYQTDQTIASIQKGEISVEVKMVAMHETIGRLLPHPRGIDFIFDIPQRVGNQNRVQYAREKRYVELARSWDHSLIVANSVMNIFAVMGELTQFWPIWFTALIWLVVVVVFTCARVTYKRKGAGRPLPEILTTESVNDISITIDNHPTMDITDSQAG